MKAINKKIVITILVILEICSMYLVYKSYNHKKILDSKIETKEKMAIKVINDNGEYESKNQLPGEGYVLNKDLTECKNQEGKKEEINLISNGENITITSTKTLYCTLYFDLPESREYDYTGDYQVFMAPKEGDYQIELWGASGGEHQDVKENTVGRGAYTKGTIHLEKNEKLYIYVGESVNKYGGVVNGYGNLTKFPFNGGGPGESSGGGATDIRLNISSTGNWDDFDSLKSRIMVAAGGGGGAYYLNIDTSKGYTRGDGGTLKGIDAKFYTSESYDYSGHGATQSSGGEPGEIFSDSYDNEKTPEMTGKFGMGGYGKWIIINSYTSSGGGGGYYGGGHGNHEGISWTGGGGGSSYISGYEGCIAIKEESTEDNVLPKDGCIEETNDINCSYHYSNKIFIDTLMLAGNEEMPTHDGDGNMIGNTGNGYAKITIVE